MLRICCLCACALLLSNAVEASSIGGALPCTDGTLADYIALGATGCSIGPLALRDFSFSVVSSSGNPTVVTPADVSVTLLPITSGYGVSYASSGFDVTAGQAVTYLLSYDIDPGPPIIRGLDVALSPQPPESEISRGQPVSPGLVSITENACVGAAFTGSLCSAPGTPTSLNVFDNGVSSILDQDQDFAGVNLIGVMTTIDLDASDGGSADFGNFSSAATASPEPASGSLAITGLLFAGALALRKLRT